MTNLIPSAGLPIGANMGVRMPLGTQLSAANDFVLALKAPYVEVDGRDVGLEERWKRLNEVVFQPAGVSSPDFSVIRDWQQVPSFLKELRALSHSVLDPQIEQLSGKRLSGQLIEEEHLTDVGIALAVQFGIVSKDPAQQLLHSLDVYHDNEFNRGLTRFISYAVMFIGAAAIIKDVIFPMAITGGAFEAKDILVPATCLLGAVGFRIASSVYRRRIAPMYKPATTT